MNLDLFWKQVFSYTSTAKELAVNFYTISLFQCQQGLDLNPKPQT
jgi:hypothetical protein